MRFPGIKVIDFKHITGDIFILIVKVPTTKTLKPLKIKGREYKFYLIPSFERKIYFQETWEPEITNLIHNLVKPGMTFIDVGANIGWYSLQASKLVGDGKVIAFEPSKERFALLQENIKVNNAENVIAVNMALSDKEETGFMGGRVFDRFTKDKSKYEKAKPIKATTLDSYLEKNQIDRADFVKIDVEGAELLVLKGMPRTIEQNPRIKILIEVHKKFLRDDEVEELFNYLSDFGLRKQLIRRNILNEHYLFWR